MASLVKVAINQAIAQALIDDIFLQKNRYFFGIGRAYDWPNENSPPDAIDSEKYEIGVRNDMLLYKQIDGTSLSFVVPRIDYVKNTIYDIYDDEINLLGKKFYATNSDFNVYKCLYNNEGTQSTIEPFGTSLDPVTYSDGYVWKYIYSIPPALRTKFLTPAVQPIYNTISSTYYSRGTLNDFIITSAGTDYVQDSTVLQVSGDGYLENNPLKLILASITKSGSGYTSAPTAVISDPFGNTQAWTATTGYIEGQILKVTGTDVRFYRVDTPGISGSTAPTHLYSDAVNGTLGLRHVGTKPLTNTTINSTGIGSVFMTDVGFGYAIAPTVTAHASGSGVQFSPALSNGQVTSIGVDSTGTGYTNTALTISSPYPAAANYATSTAYTNGTVLKYGNYYYKVTNDGTSGGTPPSHTTGTAANGTIALLVLAKQAAGVAVLGTVNSISLYGNVASANITNKGTGYTQGATTVSFSGGSPTTPATGVVQVTAGKIEKITITFPGVGYHSAPTMTISGDGTGATAASVLQYGYGYSKIPSMTFSNPQNVNGVLPEAQVSTEKTEAIIEPIIVDGKLRGIKIIDGGIGYTTANITVVGVGDDASLVASFASGDLSTPQSRNELFAVPGQLSSVKVVEAGSGITSIQYSISGDGTGAVVLPVLENGKLKQIKVLNSGLGYTRLDISFTLNAGAVAPTVREILSPLRGHGSNPIKELLSRSVSIYSKFSDEKNNNIESLNTYRQIAIIKNPLRYNLDSYLTDRVASSCIVISTNSDLGEVIANSVFTNADGDEFRAIQVLTNTMLLQPTSNSVLAPDDVLTTVINNNNVQVVVTSITLPQIDKYSGDMLFIDNLIEFRPTPEQDVSISTTIDLG